MGQITLRMKVSILMQKKEMLPHIVYLKFYLHNIHKNNSKYIKIPIVKAIKLLEENIESNFQYLTLGNGFLDMTPKV